MLFLTLSLMAACPFAHSTPTHVVHERRGDVLVEEWTKGARLDPSELIPVRIALTQTNLEKGHDILMDISDPASASYGKHLTEKEVIELFAPKRKSVAAVSSWLQGAGIHVHRQYQSANKQWIKFDATTAELEDLLHTKFHVWHRQADEDVGCEEYHVPHSVHQHVDYIMPGIHLRSTGKPKSRHSTAIRSAPPNNEVQVKPRRPPGFHGLDHCPNAMYWQCLAATYNYTAAKERTPQKGNEFGYHEFFEDGFNIRDFQAYKKFYDPRIPKDYLPEIFGIDGARKYFSDRNDLETNMDVEIGSSIIYPQGFKIYQTSEPKGNPIPHKFTRGWYNNFLDAIDGSYCTYKAYGIKGDSPKIDPHYPDKQWPHPEQCGVFKPTNVISFSDGGAEAIAPVNYLKRQCNEYMKLGMRGISLVFCSQDAGVAGAVGVPHPQKSDCLGKKGNIFAPIFPASCPYVTGVGATYFPRGANILDHNQERAIGFSGGGFSNIFEPLSYQRKATQTFLTKHKPPHKSYSTENGKNIGKDGGVFNRAGRGIPDISAIGASIVEVDGGGGDNDGGGTSSATPIWAALFNRINEERLAANKSLVGFVNPALYANPGMINDITHGHNTACGRKHPGIGFNATKGWDPVSGLGSPNYGKMLEYFMKLQ